MGVTYKLKQEVIDFIVQKKQADPSLSCRKLVTLLESSFQLDVSKSSVNAVIKEFNLSNPVGRRADKAPKNFFIPSERKHQLLAQVVPFLPQAAVPVVPVEEIAQPIEIKEELPNKVEIQAISFREELPIVKEETVHLAPDLIASAPVVLNRESEAMLDWSDEQGPLLENMGFFFIRAFMQDILRRPLLGQIFSRVAGMEPEDAALLEAAVFLKAAGCYSVENMHGPAYQSLAVMFEADPKRLEDILGQFFGKHMALSVLSVALEAELEMAFVQGAFLKCTADTGRSFYFSADLGTLLASSEGRGACPMFKAVESAVDCLIVGRKPLVFDLPQGLDASARDLLVFIDGKANDQLDRIELWSVKSMKLWSAVLKAGQKHQFIAAMHPGVGLQADFEKIGSPCIYEDPILGDRYSLEEGLYVIDHEKSFKLRAVLVVKQSGDDKIVLLTNILEKEMAKIDILEKYLKNKGFTASLHRKDEVKGIESHDLMGKTVIKMQKPLIENNLESILCAVFGSFETYVAGILSMEPEPVDSLRKLYPAAAKIRYQKDRIHVRFEVVKTEANFSQLQAAVECAHGCNIRDKAGRRICFSLISFPDK